MMPQRDDVEILARTADLLLEPREPVELIPRFLEHAAAVFQAETGFILLRIGNDAPGLSLLGIDRADAYRLAADLGRALRATGTRCRAWRPRRSSGRGAVEPGALVAALDCAPGGRGLIALFSSRAEGFDGEVDTRLMRYMADHAAAALRHAALHLQARRQAERLAIQAEELERVHQALERHSREVERSLAARSRFFASMSHELRTPINAILGYNELLRDGIFGALNARQLEAIEKIASSAAQLLALINDTLDLSKIEAGKMTIRRHRVDLPALVAEATSAMEVAAYNKGLELRVRYGDALPAIETDPARVRQILLNLLSNAVKFTSSGHIAVEVQHVPWPRGGNLPALPATEPGPEGWIAVTVEDTGIGIPSEMMPLIFGEFVQLAETGGGEKGTGLGLSISRRIARLLGGDLIVESEVGVRSRFTLFLPCPAPMRSAAALGDT